MDGKKKKKMQIRNDKNTEKKKYVVEIIHISCIDQTIVYIIFVTFQTAAAPPTNLGAGFALVNSMSIYVFPLSDVHFR